jgi:hypothetical protein
MELFEITADDTATTARRKITEVLERLLNDQPRELRLALTAALALGHEPDHRFLADRQRWLAGKLHCHERTARRRTTEAIGMLAELAEEMRHACAARSAREGWQVSATRALLRLDGPYPELTEDRTILIVRDGLNEIETRFSLPRAGPEEDDEARRLHTELLYGGRIRDSIRLAPVHFRYVIQLPREFQRGETHQYGIRFSIPSHDALAPHYALVPLVTVNSLDLTIRFDTDHLPERVWLVDGVVQRMLDEPPSRDDTLLAVDRVGDVRVRFDGLSHGLGYGVRWQFPPA